MSTSFPHLIGISGVSRSGKNLFANILQQQIATATPNIKVKQYSLARTLKLECQDFIREHLNLDVFTEKTEEKNVFRDMLVWYADVKRKQTDGKFYTQKLEEIIVNDFLDKKVDIAIVTDIRYAEYPEDEIHWLQEKHNGYLVHISKYWYDTSDILSDSEKRFVLPANEHEKKNDSKVRTAANRRLEWREVTDKYVSNDGYDSLVKNEYLNEIVIKVYNDVCKTSKCF